MTENTATAAAQPMTFVLDDDARREIELIAEYIAAPGAHRLPVTNHLFETEFENSDAANTLIVGLIAAAAKSINPQWHVQLAARSAFTSVTRSSVIFMIANKLPAGQTAPDYDGVPVTEIHIPGHRLELAYGSPMMLTPLDEHDSRMQEIARHQQ